MKEQKNDGEGQIPIVIEATCLFELLDILRRQQIVGRCPAGKRSEIGRDGQAVDFANRARDFEQYPIDIEDNRVDVGKKISGFGAKKRYAFDDVSVLGQKTKSRQSSARTPCGQADLTLGP